jgi:hypothetical protein
MREKMRPWRNVICPEGEPDAEIGVIDAFEEEIGDLSPLVARIRALISRIDPLSHYKAFENLDFLLAAIGGLDYPGSPAVDVLWRHGVIDEERRAQARDYIDAIGAWLADPDLVAAQTSQPDSGGRVVQVFEALGEPSEEKRWLAMSLRKTLKELAYTPWDFISEYDDAAFVQAAYESILERPPSPDDLAFRVEELAAGKNREAFLAEVMGGDEHRRGHLHGVAGRLK